LAATTQTKYNYNQTTTQKPKQQLINTTNICKTKPDKTKARFRSPIMQSAYSTAAGPTHNKASWPACHGE